MPDLVTNRPSLHVVAELLVAEVNYGVSPGDTYRAVPYAYVGPWTPTHDTKPSWNAPFGAARPLTEIDELLAFFSEGRSLVPEGSA